MWSNQESILTGPSQVHLESNLPKCGRIVLQKRDMEVRKSTAHMKGRVLCNKTTRVKEKGEQELPDLLKRAKKLQAEETHFTRDSCRKTLATIGGVSREQGWRGGRRGGDG